jgi:hypothetical protein
LRAIRMAQSRDEIGAKHLEFERRGSDTPRFCLVFRSVQLSIAPS